MSDTEDEGVEAARERVIAAMERSAEVYGFQRSYGRLYGLLFFADEPRSLDELVADSGYAKSTVSTAMSALERYHLVHRRSMPGEGKRAYFEAETDFWRVFQEFLRNEVLREVTVMSRALAEAEAELEAADTEQAARDLEKVRRLRRMYDRSETMIDALTSSSLDRLTDLVSRLRRE
ncbi:GbsR/MarR family transcriptional regulator [Halostella salina]|uniref:GbsR/MarR family transcriptional regulator n=1 Tax=Halostella salina TaxID=1547897 RepID=UPI000EF7A5C2|nr:transcriptional regulator [Halostella salina]